MPAVWRQGDSCTNAAARRFESALPKLHWLVKVAEARLRHAKNLTRERRNLLRAAHRNAQNDLEAGRAGMVEARIWGIELVLNSTGCLK